MPIACGQTISQPFVVAYMTEQLGVQREPPRARDRHRLRLPGGDPVAARGRRSSRVERYRTLAETARASAGASSATTMSR